MATQKEIQDLKRRHSARLLTQPGVSGVGVEQGEDGGYVLAVHLDRDDPKIVTQVSDELAGFPVKWVFSGPFHKT